MLQGKSLSDRITHARTIAESQHSPIRVQNFAELILLNRSKSGNWLIFQDETGKEFTLTYPDFLERTEQTAKYLLDCGLHQNDRIATAATNHWQTIVLYFAAWRIGLTVVPINLSEDDDRIRYILVEGQIKRIFIQCAHQKRMTELIAGLGEPIPYETYDASTKWHGNSILNTSIPSAETQALIVFTSGTTGNPKAVVLSQQNLLEDAHAISNWHGIHSQTRMMCVLPIHHVNGTVVTHITPFYAGASVVLHQKFSPKTFFESIEKHGVNVVSVVPTLLQFLTHTYENKDFQKPSTLKHIICGAGPLTIEVARQFEERFDTRVVHGYGLSETTCYSCFLPIDLSKEEHKKWMRDFGYPSIGVPVPCNEMAIHDEAGNALKAGEKGEIVIRGRNVMQEYFNNQEANEKAFTFGWFRSGDEGFYQEDEKKRPFFFITGRLKELIIRGGVNLAPLEIDEVINRVPGVKSGISVGFENDWYGEEVGAYVQRKEGSTVSEQEIIDYCKTELPFSKCPKVVVFSDSIPVTSTGKYQRMKVVHLFKEWKTIQFKK